jgi:hypothetical protein
VRPLLDQAPQTNEVGRSAALLGGLLRSVAEHSLPVRLFEIGASGGLNLLAERFRYSDDLGDTWGDPDSPVLLDGAWEGGRVPMDVQVDVVERGGCDINPVDATTEDGRLTLTSYVWPDMTARHTRLAGALAVAGEEPVDLVRADAASYVEGLGLADGHLTVVWHSVMWQYVPRAQQQRITARLAALGEQATREAPLVHLFAEPTRREPQDRHRFWVVGHRWPGGERQYLGQMAPHGIPVVWE